MEKDFIADGYTGALQILDKGVNKPFKQHVQDTAIMWTIANQDTAKPTRVNMARWIEQAWNRITATNITNTWNSVGLPSYNVGDGAEVQRGWKTAL